MAEAHLKAGNGSGTSSAGPKKISREILEQIDRRKETEEEAAQRKQLGKKIYDNNLKRVNELLRKKGVWRMQMNAVGEIVTVLKGSGKRQQGEVSLVISELGKVPTFGSRTSLSPLQQDIVKHLEDDIFKLLHVKDEAELIPPEQQEEMETVVKHELEQLTQRFGDLPPSHREIEEMRKAKAKKANDLDDLVSWIEGDDGADDEPELTFEQLLEKEKRRKAKKQRQKQRRQQERQAQSQSQGGSGGGD